jgi:cell division transport system ATP-binding protein
MIKLRNVSKIYGIDSKALKNVNLKIEKQEFVFIVGGSGAGKSTLVKLLTCEEVPSTGHVVVNNVDVKTLKRKQIPKYRRNIGIVFQDFRLIDKLSVFDNVAFAMRVTGFSAKTVKERVPYILGLVGLQEKAARKPRTLSGGEKQRVGIARALVNNPALIIADEPTGNIDPALSYEIIDLLNEINKRGTTVIMVTHEHDLVDRFNRRVIELHNGEVTSDTGKITGKLKKRVSKVPFSEAVKTSESAKSAAAVSSEIEVNI